MPVCCTLKSKTNKEHLLRQKLPIDNLCILIALPWNMFMTFWILIIRENYTVYYKSSSTMVIKSLHTLAKIYK